LFTIKSATSTRPISAPTNSNPGVKLELVAAELVWLSAVAFAVEVDVAAEPLLEPEPMSEPPPLLSDFSAMVTVNGYDSKRRSAA
jgi:hypothetical protein